MNIFVARLNYDTTESDLQYAFEEFGNVDSVKIIMDKQTGRSKGFGFVEMANEEEGQAAIDALNDTELDGRTIVVKKAEPRENRDRGGYGGGRGGGYGGGRGGGYGGGRGGGYGGDRRGGGGYRDRRDNDSYNRY
ncbi:MAG: RNA-binding protein [Bacteroidota bacterium]